MKRRWKILLVVVLSVVLCSLYLLLPGGNQRAVERFKQELRSNGERLTIAELTPQQSGNLSPAAMLLSGGSNLPPSPFNLPRLRMIAPGRAQVMFTNIPESLMNDYIQNTNAMAQIRKALETPTLDFDLDYSRAYQINISYLTTMKQIELLAVGTAMEAYQRKDFDEARSDLLAGADLVRLHTNDLTMISDLVRVADAGIAFSANWEALEGAAWTDTQLAELQSKWEDMDLFRLSVRSLEIERAFIVKEFADARTKTPLGSNPFAVIQSVPPTAAPATQGGPGYKFVSGLKNFYDRYPRLWMWKSSWSYDEELFQLQSISAAKETAVRIVETFAAAPALEELRSRETNITRLHPDAEGHYFLSSGPDNYIRYLEKLSEMEAARRVQVVAIALKRYQLRHGMYPATLNELVPDFVSRVPIDYMDGKPLRYRLLPDGDFVLYSIGTDGKDDGGDAARAEGASLIWFLGHDAVWPRPASPQEIQSYDKTHVMPVWPSNGK